MYSKCCGQLFIAPVLMVTLFEKYYNTMAGLMYVSSEVSWSAGERDRLLGCALWKLTKLEPNIQHTRLPMWSTGNCGLVVQRGPLPIEIWTTNRMKGQIFVSMQAWMTVTSVIKWTALCVCCAQLNLNLCAAQLQTVEIEFIIFVVHNLY